MKKLHYFISILVFALLGCETSFSFQERGIMLLEVLDENGQPQTNVDLTLYRTLDDWAFDERALGNFTTNAEGVATIPNLSGEYYIDAVSGSLNNWQNPSALLVEDGSISLNYVYVSETINGYISTATGLDWEIVAVLDNTGNPDASRSCEVGDIITFTRAGAYEKRDSNGDCSTAFIEGSWWGVGMQEVWLLLDQGTTVIPTTVSSLSVNSFRLSYLIDSELVTYEYRRR